MWGGLITIDTCERDQSIIILVSRMLLLHAVCLFAF